MQKVYCSALFGLLFTIIAIGQPALQWDVRFNGPGAVDKGELIALDGFGNIYVAGVSDAANYLSDYILIKYNQTGDTLWTKRYNGTANAEDVPTALKIDDNNNVYLTGKSKRAGTGFDIVTFKYNAEGVQQWMAVYNGGANLDDIPYAIEIDVAGNVYVVGSAYYSFGSTSTDGVVIKYNQAGAELWKINANQYSVNEVVNLIAINKNNGNLIVAVCIGEVGDGSYRLLELSPSNGSIIKLYNHNFQTVWGFADAMVLDGLGNIFVTSTHAQVDNPTHVHTAKFNYGVSEHAWEYLRYTSYSYERRYQGIDLKVDVNSNAYILYSYYNGQYYIVRTEKLYSNGYAAWDKTFNSIPNINEHAVSFKLGGDINAPDVFVTSYSSNGDISVIKYSNNGDLAWTKSYDCGSNGVDVVADMAIDSMENLYLTGYSSCNGTYQDIKSIKYCASAPLASILPPASTNICQGATVTLAAETCTGCTYLWSNNATTPIIQDTLSVTTSYTVEVTNASGCSAVSDPVTINVNPAPVILISGVTSICEGTSTILTASGASNYSWTPTNGVSNPNSPSPVFSPTSTQTYTVTGTLNGCPGSAQVTITVNSQPTVVIQGEDAICFGTSTQLTASGATSYTWSPATGLSNPNIQNPMASPQTTTTYIVTGTKDGCSDTASVTVTVNVVDVEVSGDTSLCNGEIIYNLTASGADTYSWLPETGLSDPGAANPEVSPPSTTTYTITGTVGECTGQTSVKITVKPKPVVEGYGATSICDGASAQLNASGAPAYSWTPNQSLDNANIQNPVATPSATTTYVVTGILNGCTDTAWVKVTVNPIPVITLAGPTYAICPEEPALLFAYADIGIDKWLWEPAGSLSNPAIFNPVATPAMTTTYTVTGTTADECSDTASITITVTPLPGQPGPITGEATACSGAIQQYSVPTVAGADSYNWTIPSGWTGSSNASSITVTPSPGTGQISVTAENECGESPPSTFSVTIHETPEKPIITKLDPITLKSSSPIGNQWYKNGTMMQGETGELLVVADTGYYKVIVTINGCSSEESDQEYVEPPSSVNSVNSKPSITLFPNPTTGILHIRASGLDSGSCHLLATNSLGQVVTEWKGETDGYGILDIQIDLSGFASGVYFINIKTANNQYSTIVNKTLN